MKKKFRVGIIGFGTVAQTHARVLSAMDDVEIVAVADVKPASELKPLPEGAKLYSDYKEMIDKERPDAVHICLPHYLHYEVAVYCVEKKIPTLLEKPMVLNGELADSLIRKVNEEKTFFAVCLQNRLNNTFCTLQSMLASGKYGTVKGIKGVALWYRPESYYLASPWRGKLNEAGGGCLINQAIHTLDQMLLLGGEVSEVSASVSTLTGYDIEVEDSATVRIGFRNGVVGLLMASNANANNSSIELEVVTDSHILRIKDFVLSVASKYDEYSFRPVTQDEILPGSKSYYGVGHKMLIRNFYDALSNGGNGWFVPAEEGAKVIRLLDAIYKSGREGKKVIMEEN